MIAPVNTNSGSTTSVVSDTSPKTPSWGSKILGWLPRILVGAALVTGNGVQSNGLQEAEPKIEEVGQTPQEGQQKVQRIYDNFISYQVANVQQKNPVCGGSQARREVLETHKATLERIRLARNETEGLEAIRGVVPNFRHFSLEETVFKDVKFYLQQSKPAYHCIKSILLGAEGSYDVLGGALVTFKPFSRNEAIYSNKSSQASRSNSSWGERSLELMTGGPSHAFVHEVAHWVMYKARGVNSSTIEIYTKQGEGLCTPNGDISHLSPIDLSLVSAAGPVANMIYSSGKLMAVAALKDHLPWPVALTIVLGTSYQIGQELRYCYSSAIDKDEGDFGDIAKRSKTHLAVASVALVTPIVLGGLAIASRFL